MYVRLFFCSITAGGRMSNMVLGGAFYGTMEASQIDHVRTHDYFRDSGNFQQDSYLDHLFSVNPLDPSRIFDADGDMT